jgi:hypothetical protein
MGRRLEHRRWIATNHMKSLRLKFTGLIALAGLAIAGNTTPAGAQGNGLPNGTDVVHFLYRTAMDPQEDAIATGRVETRFQQQGSSTIQALDVFLSNLEPQGTYHLFAWTDVEDQFEPLYVTNVTANARGLGSLRFLNRGESNKPLGRGRLALPDGLNPVSSIGQLIVTDSSTQAVLTASFDANGKLQYLVKKHMENEGLDEDADAVLRVKVNTQSCQTRLVAVNLDPSTDYLLAVDGWPCKQLTTTSTGKLVDTQMFGNPMQMLDVDTIEIWNTSSNAVLSFVMP